MKPIRAFALAGENVNVGELRHVAHFRVWARRKNTEILRFAQDEVPFWEDGGVNLG